LFVEEKKRRQKERKSFEMIKYLMMKMFRITFASYQQSNRLKTWHFQCNMRNNTVDTKPRVMSTNDDEGERKRNPRKLKSLLRKEGRFVNDGTLISMI
jgi:hypothetical protein